MKIAVGLSGGVDSSVAAWLLKEQGHEVVAIFMQNWHDTTGTLFGECPWEEERAVAQMVAKKIGIPFHFVDLSSEYRARVIDYMFSEYERGRTPNPDVLCNREIKFEAFLKRGLELGAQFVATGHYSRVERRVDINGEESFHLMMGVDQNKDQSYFLCQLSQDQLSKALFPIGALTKKEVREIAKRAALPTAEKRDSQGICFVGKVDLPIFLQQKLAAKKGVVIEVPKSFYQGREIGEHFRFNREMGRVIGEHNGAHFYTIGQRRGLNIGGHIEPLFVLSTDVQENIIYVGEGGAHPGLYRREIAIEREGLHWIAEGEALEVGESREYSVRIRYRQPLQEATLIQEESGLKIEFKEPQRAVAPGQFAAWYCGEELIGSGVISF